MIQKHLVFLALFAATPAFASSSFLIDFEKTWDYSNGDVNNYYNGGTAADGTTGPNLGVSFTGVSGLSNDANFTYYTNAPSMQGVAYVYTTAFMDVAAGVNNALSFFYSSPSDVVGAVKVYSGLDGAGTLLGSFDLTANSSAAYDTWTQDIIHFNGTAESFDLTVSGANLVALDNIGTVPTPATLWLLAAGLPVFSAFSRRGKASIRAFR